MAEIDAEQRHELEMMIRELETENANLQVIFYLIESVFSYVITHKFGILFGLCQFLWYFVIACHFGDFGLT